jgi:membrane protease YdiL (CAAX protease family)
VTDHDAERERAVRAALVLVVTILATYNIARSAAIPGDAHFVANLLTAGVVLALGLTIGLTRDELGLAQDHLRAGVRLGLITSALIGAVIVIAAAVPATSELFADDRVDVSFTEMALRVVVVIPLGTVFVEETIFRGVLHGLLRRRYAIRAASIWGAAVFGLWHLFPVWRSHDDATFWDLGRWATISATFVATFIAGLGFIWLRHRSGHLIAPVFAHIATNSIPFAVAWLLA